MKKFIKVWLITFVLAALVKILYNRFFGGMMSPEKAYHWDRIIDDLPYTVFVSILFAFAGVYWYKQDHKK